MDNDNKEYVEGEGFIMELNGSVKKLNPHQFLTAYEQRSSEYISYLESEQKKRDEIDRQTTRLINFVKVVFWPLLTSAFIIVTAVFFDFYVGIISGVSAVGTIIIALYYWLEGDY